jgi:RNA polymerase sigma-70 factor (ECF subfamily)
VCVAAYQWERPVALSEVDRQLLRECLDHASQSWEAFVDRFLGLVVHVVNHTAQARSLELVPHDIEDLASEVFLALLADDYAALRRFRGESSLATYMTVIARRVVIRELLKRRAVVSLSDMHEEASHDTPDDDLLNREEVEQLLTHLEENEARIVRLHYLEGKSYDEISTSTGMPANSIGPTLSRAKAKMRRSSVNS